MNIYLFIDLDKNDTYTMMLILKTNNTTGGEGTVKIESSLREREMNR